MCPVIYTSFTLDNLYQPSSWTATLFLTVTVPANYFPWGIKCINFPRAFRPTLTVSCSNFSSSPDMCRPCQCVMTLVQTLSISTTCTASAVSPLVGCVGCNYLPLLGASAVSPLVGCVGCLLVWRMAMIEAESESMVDNWYHYDISGRLQTTSENSNPYLAYCAKCLFIVMAYRNLYPLNRRLRTYPVYRTLRTLFNFFSVNIWAFLIILVYCV